MNPLITAAFLIFLLPMSALRASDDASPAPSSSVSATPSASASPNAALSPAWESEIPGTRHSMYTEPMKELLRHWPPPDLGEPGENGNPVWLEAIRTPSDSNYVGTRKRVFIHAPIEKVRATIDDYDSYHDVFDGVVGVKILERAPDRLVTAWERESPVFFVRNPRYEQVYVWQTVSPTRMFCRYQLRSGNSVNFVDGIIVLESAPDGTYLSGYDFFQADWGLAKTFAGGKIWKTTLENAFRADVAMKSRIEHPDWSLKQLTREAHQVLERFPFEKIRYKAALYEPRPAQAGASPSSSGPSSTTGSSISGSSTTAEASAVSALPSAGASGRPER